MPIDTLWGMSAQRVRVGSAAAAATVVLLAGCWSAPRAAPAAPLRPGWQAVTLPVPSGAPGRLLLRDVAQCGGRWFAVGAVADAAGATRPAAWSSPDTATWTPLRLTARSAYGAENVLTAAACRNGLLAAVGAKSGGVHGNPRISTWRQLADGTAVEVPAEFEVFGGPDAVNVGRIAGGPAGWLIAGNRGTGAAVWSSADATEFQLVSGVAPLASDPAGRSWAADAAATASGWVLVGSLRSPGRPGGDPAVWTSPDGRAWQRRVLPDAAPPGDLQRVVAVGDRLVGLGRRGDSLAAWTAGPEGADWRPGGSLPAAAGGPTAQVAALTSTGGGVAAVVSTPTGVTGWFSPDGGGWSAVEVPRPLPGGADRSVALAGSADRLVLAADDAEGGSLWTAQAPGRPG